MPNLIDDLRSGQSAAVEVLHREICRTLDDECGDDPGKRRRLKDKLIGIIGKALVEAECRERPSYDLSHLPGWVRDIGGAGYRALG